MTQVRITDRAVRALVMVTFFAYFAAPERWVFRLLLANLVVLGIWGVIYPEGPLGWAKAAHPSIDVHDTSTWWVSRLIGGCFILFAVMLAVSIGELR
jgi:hypothetical protein